MAKGDFETLYIGVREKEGRIYSDEEVKCLPFVQPSHRYYSEWMVRTETLQRLTTYFEKQKRPLNILEIGCGNGWLSHRLAALPGSQVTGTDINYVEVQQAARVFGDVSNLHFLYAQAEQNVFKEGQFDMILFAASIQYFPSLEKIIHPVLKLLKRGGEIHVVDSHFYPLPDVSAARQRSLLYYETCGFPEMAGCYFHHTLDSLDVFNYSILYNPNSIFNKFLKNKYPFYWIRIVNKD